MEIPEVERNPEEGRLVLQRRGLDVLVDGHLPVEMRDQQLPARDLIRRRQRGPNEMLQRRHGRGRVDNIAALRGLQGLRLRGVHGRGEERGPEVGDGVDGGRALEGGDQRGLVAGVGFDDLDALLLQFLRLGGTRVPRDGADLPAGVREE